MNWRSWTKALRRYTGILRDRLRKGKSGIRRKLLLCKKDCRSDGKKRGYSGAGGKKQKFGRELFCKSQGRPKEEQEKFQGSA